jgi:hypothetical protein
MIEVKLKSTGFAELDSKLRFMATTAANRIVGTATRAGLRVAEKFIRDQIPSTIKTAIIAKDKGIGSTTKKKSSNGTSGKVGVGVGGTQKKAGSVQIDRGKRKGVGVSARNLHWFAMGTAERFTGSKRIRRKNNWNRRIQTGKPVHATGRIDYAKFGGFVQRGMAAGKSAIFDKMRASVEKNLAIVAQRGVIGAAEGLADGN